MNAWTTKVQGAGFNSGFSKYLWWAAFILGPYLGIVMLLFLLTDWDDIDCFTLGVTRLFGKDKKAKGEGADRPGKGNKGKSHQEEIYN